MMHGNFDSWSQSTRASSVQIFIGLEIKFRCQSSWHMLAHAYFSATPQAAFPLLENNYGLC